MTCGIYKLVFKGTDKVYIGESENIENRFRHHLYTIGNGRASQKIKDAVFLYGKPTLVILAECTPNDLYPLEKETIEIYNSVAEGFNTRSEAYAGNSLKGEDSGLSLFSNKEIEEVFFLLIGDYMPFKEISKITGVTINVIENISRLKSHTWLKDLYPNEYRILEDKKSKRISLGSSALGRGKVYPAIQSPTGEIYYDIPNAKLFAEKHLLNHSHLVGVLNSKRKSHKGWKLYKGELS